MSQAPPSPLRVPSGRSIEQSSTELLLHYYYSEYMKTRKGAQRNIYLVSLSAIRKGNPPGPHLEILHRNQVRLPIQRQLFLLYLDCCFVCRVGLSLQVVPLTYISPHQKLQV